MTGLTEDLRNMMKANLTPKKSMKNTIQLIGVVNGGIYFCAFFAHYVVDFRHKQSIPKFLHL